MQNRLIICPTARLVRAIQANIAQANQINGLTQWQTAHVLTLPQWLDNFTELCMLNGEIAQPKTLLLPFNEQLLWEEVITQSLKKNMFGALFDVSGLASAAVEANKYMIAWRLHLPREQMSEESRQFVQWQRDFQQRCKQLNVLESVRYMDWQLDYLLDSQLKLPTNIAFAGFDQTAPQEQRLREILMQKNVVVTNFLTTNAAPAQAKHIALDNIEAECRAAVAWAKQQLEENPNTKLAIVAPQLSDIRNQLADFLDDTFYPASVNPSQFDMPRNYNFSLGTPLNQQPIIQAALNLLRLLSSYQLQQADVSAVLLSPFWSKNSQEADARAQLDASMREHLPMQLTLTQFVAHANNQLKKGLGITHLLTHIDAAMAISSNRALPSQWVQTFNAILAALQWPGERNINSLEYQAISAWQKSLQTLAKLDILGKNLSPSEALQRVQQTCAEQVFQTETTQQVSIEIVGIMEALSAPVDTMWCMGMNDHIWPPPARPNPLLPAFIQRAAKLPNADNSVQAAFAATVQQRILHSAKHIIFSSSKTENQSQLRASPLIKDIVSIESMPLIATLAERLSLEDGLTNNANLEHLPDQFAPAIQAGEHVSGGTGLFRTQAICPAWAFYQYRLGAKALKIPASGLDNKVRGALVHEVLRQFWQQYSNFADLRDMRETTLEQAINKAVRSTLRQFTESNNTVSATMLTLEHERLYKLINAWLQYEKQRNVAFNIVACEFEQKVTINGIEVTLIIDRIQQLVGVGERGVSERAGGLEYIDYKTGQQPKMSNWDKNRILDPQLPIYATFGSNNTQVASVQFGWVKLAEHTFTGVSVDNFDTEIEKRKPKFLQAFDDWPSLLMHWKTSIEAIAEEIKLGEATVRFDSEKDLMYCEVLPLLRLPERHLQFERFQFDSSEKSQPNKAGA